MINKKLRLWIIILGFVLVSSIIFHLPSKSLSFLVQYFLGQKYGVSCKWTALKGGFFDVITLEGFRISGEGHTLLKCPKISSNIKFRDLVFPDSAYPYYILLKEPKVSINNFSSLQVNAPVIFLNRNTKILISKARVILEDTNKVIALKLKKISGEVNRDDDSLSMYFSSPDDLTKLKGSIDLSSRKGKLEIVGGKVKLPQTDLPPVEINGNVVMEEEGIGIEKGFVSLGNLELNVCGSIFTDRTISLEINPVTAGKDTSGESRFLVKGSLDEPKIITNLGIIETVFKIKGTNYNNGKLIFPEIAGKIRLPGFMPFGLDGKLILGTNFVGFENITLANVLNIDGMLSKDKDSRLKLWIKDTKGEDLAQQLPDALKPLISAHTVDARLSLYGKIDNLQGSGMLKLFSQPMEIACRYRQNRFSFNSIGEGPFNLSGSINLDKEPKIKIKGTFFNMDFVELMSFFNKNADSSLRGTVNGEFKIKGTINDPLIRAKLEIEDGQCGDIKFDVLYLNLEGSVDKLDLKHSMAYYKEVPAELTGYIDPKAKNFFTHLNIVPTADTFIWKGINVIRNKDDKTVIFGRDVDENVSVHFKSPLSSDPEGDVLDEEPEIEVEYKLLEDKSILIKMEEDEGTVGLEHKVKF